MLSCVVTFDVPERLPLNPDVPLMTFDLKDQVLPAASGARMPVPSLGAYRKTPLLIRFQE